MSPKKISNKAQHGSLFQGNHSGEFASITNNYECSAQCRSTQRFMITKLEMLNDIIHEKNRTINKLSNQLNLVKEIHKKICGEPDPTQIELFNSQNFEEN